MSPDSKRQRTDDHSFTEIESIAADFRSRRSAFLTSLSRGVSPPGRESVTMPDGLDGLDGLDGPGLKQPLKLKAETQLVTTTAPKKEPHTINARNSKPRVVPSPFKLTRIRDLPASANVDTISIRDILGDVMLKEVWLFDFLYDVDWVMQQFDPDIRPLVSVMLVHGSWRKEDSNRVHIEEASKRYSNIKPIIAYMPDMYGCHHSKCMVLFRHDDLAQVIVHTANMIEQDWRNLSQGVWLSPLLPMQGQTVVNGRTNSHPPIGSGARFKHDFVAYLQHYGNRTTNLVSQLEKYDFSLIRAALIAHVPAKVNIRETDPEGQPWGWLALRRALRSIPLQTPMDKRRIPHIICQVSSIASLSEKWIRQTLISTLSQTSTPPVPESPDKKPKPPSFKQTEAKFSIIFPTSSEVRASLDGYAAGASIHCKLQTASQRKQFEIMKPHLCHWNPPTIQFPSGTTSNSNLPTPVPRQTMGKALRGPAAPHIKTFIRFQDSSNHNEIDWALLTSANMSTQAWGTAASAMTGSGTGEVRISSYELGVLVWPDLFLNEGDYDDSVKEKRSEKKRNGSAKMIPLFGSDTPTDAQVAQAISSSLSTGRSTKPSVLADPETTEPSSAEENQHTSNSSLPSASEPDSDPEVIIGLRMPYDLPLTPYSANDEVWSARSSYTEPDRFGRVWNV